MSRDAELLKATVHPKIYRAAKEECQIILEKKLKFRLKDVHIQYFMIVTVRTEVVDEDVYEMQQIQETREEADKPIAAVAADSDIPAAIKYPLGSVLAHVVVFCQSVDSYDVVSEGPMEKLICTEVTFSACISGHVDTAWQVVSAVEK